MAWGPAALVLPAKNRRGVRPDVKKEVSPLFLNSQEDAVKRFIHRHADKVIGVLSGFDRLVFRGTLRRIAFVDGLMAFLGWKHVLLKHFGAYAHAVSERIKAASCQAAREQGRPIQYLASSRSSKEAIASRIAERDNIREGLICILTCVEPCRTFEIYRNRDAKRLELVHRIRKCLHLYHYFQDPEFGFMHARIQTWFPFNVQVCLNGREWLSRMLDRDRLDYRRRDNCFPWIADMDRAQHLADRMLRRSWPTILRRFAHRLNPAHREIFPGDTRGYYWSVYQSEWATDVLFRDARTLSSIYPPLVRHGMTTFSSADVMRFLGARLRPGTFDGEIVSDFKDRPEGVRIKHRLGANSVKLYDKQGSVLRAETTLQDASAFKVFRAKEGDPKGPKAWRQMRRGIADLHRRARVSQACNERYLDALAAADTSQSLGDLALSVSRPVRWKGYRFRGLHPWAFDDIRLFQTLCRGEFSIHGFRNRDLLPHLFLAPARDADEIRRRSARISRLIRLLRAHGLIQKLPSSYRYRLTPRGREILPPLVSAQQITLKQLISATA